MSGLPDRALRLLDGDLTLGSDWSDISSVALSCFRREWTFEQFSDKLYDSALGKRYARGKRQNFKTREQFDKNIRRAWEFADDGMDYGYDERIVRERLGDLLARVQAAPWPGRGGSSERAVAIALVTLGHELNRFTVDATTHTIALRAALSKRAASEATWRLARKGLLTINKPEPGKATTYMLNLGWGVKE